MWFIFLIFCIITAFSIFLFNFEYWHKIVDGLNTEYYAIFCVIFDFSNNSCVHSFLSHCFVVPFIWSVRVD